MTVIDTSEGAGRCQSSKSGLAGGRFPQKDRHKHKDKHLIMIELLM
jgi:hypothetical protein